MGPDANGTFPNIGSFAFSVQLITHGSTVTTLSRLGFTLDSKNPGFVSTVAEISIAMAPKFSNVYKLKITGR